MLLVTEKKKSLKNFGERMKRKIVVVTTDGERLVQTLRINTAAHLRIVKRIGKNFEFSNPAELILSK